MKKNNRSRLLFVFGIALSVLPPVLATVSYFPVWKNEGTYTKISGLALCLILIAAVPLWRYFKAYLRSPSAPFIWFTVFAVFFSLSKIADEVTVISFVGFVSNLIGAFFFRMSRRGVKKIDEN